jgi:hypothetical protein
MFGTIGHTLDVLFTEYGVLSISGGPPYIRTIDNSVRSVFQRTSANPNVHLVHKSNSLMYKFNCTRQLHESIVVMWLCKCECRTHRESALSKTNFKVPKLIKSQPSSDFKHVACIK